jgi:hypothetical protein
LGGSFTDPEPVLRNHPSPARFVECVNLSKESDKYSCKFEVKNSVFTENNSSSVAEIFTYVEADDGSHRLYDDHFAECLHWKNQRVIYHSRILIEKASLELLCVGTVKIEK